MIEDTSSFVYDYLDTEFVSQFAETQLGVFHISLAVYDLKGKLVFQVNSTKSNHTFLEDLTEDTRLFEEGMWLRDDGQCVETQDAGGHNILIAPIRIDEGPVGILLCSLDADSALVNNSDNAKLFVETCGRILADSLSDKRTVADLSTELSERYEELSLVYTLSESLDISQKETYALDHICESVAETLYADLLVVQVPNEEYERVYAPNGEIDEQWRVLADTIKAELTDDRITFAVNNLDVHKTLRNSRGRYLHAIAVSIDVDGDPGFLALFRKDKDEQFFAGDIRLFEGIAKHFCTFLTNRKISEARQELFDSSIFGLARLAESRDPETGEHLDRTSRYVQIISEILLKDLNLNKEEHEQTVWDYTRCSPLHDIGKVGLPDAILCKPGKVTAEEFDVIKTHTTIGGDTLRDIENRLRWGSNTFLTTGKDIAYAHHEKWNGSGYPFGLAGEDIPLAARIMALADVYDALTSKRCYKDAFSHEKAREIIVGDSGTHFDPDVVEAFLAVEDQFIKIGEQYHD